MKLEDLYAYYFDSSLKDSIYLSETDYWKDMFRFLDIVLSVACSLKNTEQDQSKVLELENMHLKGVPVTASDVIFALMDSVHSKEQENQMQMVNMILNQAKEHIMDRLTLTSQESGMYRCDQLCSRLHVNEFEKFLVLLGCANYYDSKYEIIFAYLQGDVRMKLPSFRMARSLYCLFTNVENIVPRQGILYSIVLEQKELYDNICLSQTYTLTPRVYAWFLGEDELPIELSFAVEKPVAIDDFRVNDSRNKSASWLAETIQLPCRKIVNLYSSTKSERICFLRLAVKKVNCQPIIVYIERLKELDRSEQEKILNGAFLEATLNHAFLCFIVVKWKPDILYKYFKMMETVIWITETKDTSFKDVDMIYSAFKCPEIGNDERKQIWNQCLRSYNIDDDVDVNALANRYIISARIIKNAVWGAECQRSCEQKEKIEMVHIVEAVKEQSENRFSGVARLVPAVYCWDDLIVSKETAKQLHMICDQIKYKDVVHQQWGMGKKSAYGNGVCALFYGTPGTGKTMAVQVLSNELGINVYRIDLSTLVSKYIGETEKNISRVFDEAKGTNALLFFDEADSLFAKRCEIRDSMDRNANAQTAHLLQEIELYDGLTVLATNYANNIDDAFKRRIKYMVKFIFPSSELRLSLWKSMIPENMPFGETIDFEFFADKFELSGSSIKEIIIQAAYLAAASHMFVTNKHIIEAIKLNYNKYGKTLTDKDFGYLC